MSNPKRLFGVYTAAMRFLTVMAVFALALSSSALAGGAGESGVHFYLGSPFEARTGQPVPDMGVQAKTDAVVRAADGVYGVIGRDLLVEQPITQDQPPYAADQLTRVTVVDLLQNDMCDDLYCDIQGWQVRELPLGRVRASHQRLTLHLEDAGYAQTRTARQRLGSRVWTVDYFVTLHFKGGRTLKVLMLSGERNPAYRR